MSAPFPEPFATATAELPSLASGFVRFTSWLEPKAFCAGRFPADIATVTCGVFPGNKAYTVIVSFWCAGVGALVNFLDADLPSRAQTRHWIHL
jgi:hypothetical protein